METPIIPDRVGSLQARQDELNMEPPIIPDRAGSLQARQDDWEKRNEILQSNRDGLKRKISSTSFKDSPTEHTRMKIQDFENEITVVKHDAKRWDMEAEHRRIGPKTHRERRKENYNRIISLGDLAWQQTKLLYDIEQKEPGYELLTPDYSGAFASTLLSLYKDPSTSRKRKGYMQSELRRMAIAIYEPSKGAATSDTFWCPIAKDYFPKTTVVAAHIVPYSLSKGIAEYLFGNGSEARMNTPDNRLMISKEIEYSMDHHQFVLIPVDRTESPLKRWKLHITMDDARKKLLYPNRFLGDLDGSELKFMNDSRPAARFLYYHFLMTIMVCRDRQKAGWEKNMKLLSGKPFATWGRWLRTSVMLSLARTAGDLTPEVEKALRDQNCSFPDDQKLSDKEEVEVARRCAEAAINREKKKMEIPNSEDDEEDEEDNDDDEEGEEE